MPKMDGLTSTRHIRAFEREHNLPPAAIIMLTGLGSASVQQEAYSSGANMLLTKPVRLRELGRILSEMKEKGVRRRLSSARESG
jgi:CheY-like chemotaxis protein